MFKAWVGTTSSTTEEPSVVSLGAYGTEREAWEAADSWHINNNNPDTLVVLIDLGD